jgi:hypothetical protein
MAANTDAKDRTRGQHLAVRAEARKSDQNPAAAVRAMALAFTLEVSRFADLIGRGTPSPAHLNLELAI